MSISQAFPEGLLSATPWAHRGATARMRVPGRATVLASFQEFMLLTFREGKGGREERNIDGLPLIWDPTRDRTRNSGKYPDWELNQRPFALRDDAQPTRATPVRAGASALRAHPSTHGLPCALCCPGLPTTGDLMLSQALRGLLLTMAFRQVRRPRSQIGSWPRRRGSVHRQAQGCSGWEGPASGGRA